MTAEVTTDSTRSRIARWIRPEIRAMSAYQVPSSTGMIKLDAMENPYPWPDEMRSAWLERLNRAELNRYPDPRGQELSASIADWCGLPNSDWIMLGNGSDELIQIIQVAVCGPERSVLSPVPSFVMYRLLAECFGMAFIGVPLRPDFKLDIDRLIDTIRREQPACIFLAYPNNPTGGLFDRDSLGAVLQVAEGLVIVDEAYHAFCGRSFINEVPDHDNLLVMRTFSKLGLAGLRLGFLVGSPEWLGEFNKIRLPYNVNSLTQLSVQFALEHMSWFEDSARRVREERERLASALQAFSSLEVFNSEANFILFRLPDQGAERVYQALLAENILIKRLDGADPSLRGCLRVTVGTREENDQFLSVISRWLPDGTAADRGS